MNNTMSSGNINDLDAHPRLIAAARKAGFNSSWKIIEASLGELKSKTGLNDLEADRLIRAAASRCSPSFCTGFQILQENYIHKNSFFVKIGPVKLDQSLNGGIPCRGLTELAGESSSGKTQIALQLALNCQLPLNSGGLGKGVAYICTETQFPVSRLNQLISSRVNLKTFNEKSFSDNIFVHHLPDMDDLVDCVRYQLPKFVCNRGIGLVIIDSVAAVFRGSEERQEIKSKMIQQLGFRLRKLVDEQNVAVLAINQVTSAIDGNVYGITEDNITPALGLSWANLVTTRIMLKNTSFSVPLRKDKTSNCNSSVKGEGKESIKKSNTHSRVRTMDIIFSPWLPRRSTPFIVTKNGIEDVEIESMDLNL